MSKMNLPNKLTIFRVILIVPFVILLLGGEAGWFGNNRLIPDIAALVIFIIASLTDLIDGKIARKYVDFTQGLDARLLTVENIRAINAVKVKEIHFAWDYMDYATNNAVLHGLFLYLTYGKKNRHGQYATVYVLTNYNTTMDENLFRIYTLRDNVACAKRRLRQEKNIRKKRGEDPAKVVTLRSVPLPDDVPPWM